MLKKVPNITPGALGKVFSRRVLLSCFGSLNPLAVDHQSSVVMPTVYGIGTALPVVAFAILIALKVKWAGMAFNKFRAFEKWARGITAAAFILVGIYCSLIFLCEIELTF